MRGSPLPALVLAAVLAAGALTPLLARRLGRSVGYVLTAVYLAAGSALLLALPAILAGRSVVSSAPWVPGLGLRFSLVLDGLSLVFSVIVLGVGAVVMAYTPRYLGAHGDHGALLGLLTAFAGAMLGLVLAGDVFLLFAFWELTGFISFLLIGGKGDDASRSAAVRALLVTAGGGLALFAGLVLMTVASGTPDLGAILADPGRVSAGGVGAAVSALVLIGAFTKSAQVPFHFWLPGAMVAPTPVSTYLHAATMVKAGVYLLARLSPLFAGRSPWSLVIILTGLATAVFGAAAALKQHDLKALLAYSTVSQLGFLTALVGVGTFAALAAAIIHTFAHALYKSTLFMVVGIIDREAGSRDIRELSGLRRVMPLTAAVTGLAGLSMAGFPPFLGFVSKEEAFGAFLREPGPAWLRPTASALAVTAAVMTFAYGLRIFSGAFAGPLRQPHLREPAFPFLAPAAITASLGALLGPIVSGLNPILDRAAESATGHAGSVGLALWHGLTPALGLSTVTLLGGGVLYLIRGRIDTLGDRVRAPTSGAAAFDAAYAGLLRLGAWTARASLPGSLAGYVAWIVAGATLPGLLAWIWWRPELPGRAPGSPALEWVLVLAVAAAALGLVRARTRLGAIATGGTLGFLVALLFGTLGGPDLVVTQLLVETLTVVLMVLVLRRLSPGFARVSRRRRVAAACAGVAVGAVAALATSSFTGRRGLSEAGAYFLRAAPRVAGGRNVVNTILVDFRALDTLGEITVVAVAGLGAAAVAMAARRPR